MVATTNSHVSACPIEKHPNLALCVAIYYYIHIISQPCIRICSLIDDFLLFCFSNIPHTYNKPVSRMGPPFKMQRYLRTDSDIVGQHVGCLFTPCCLKAA